MDAAAAAIAAVAKNVDTGAFASDLEAARQALQPACVVPWDAAHRPGAQAGVRALQVSVGLQARLDFFLRMPLGLWLVRLRLMP